VDVRRGEPAETDAARFALFVTFFPRLVAGPILRFHEVMPQIPRAGRMEQTATDLAVGLTLFSIGLAKKTVLADGIAPYASAVFANAALGGSVDLLSAWGGVLAYTMQIYFDFSGYSDMAIGIARMFGLRFPMNFNSPYKSTSIVEFWRRWHITLSRFLRDYLYFSLGGNRRGAVRRYANLLVTMLLGGLWHGANWTFVAWGLLHGGYLMVNHAWQELCRRSAMAAALARSPLSRPVGWALTMLAVVVAWVFFRAPDFATAGRLLTAMVGGHGIALPAGLVDALRPLQPVLAALGISEAGGSGSRLVLTWAWVAGLGAIALALPNSQQVLRAWRPVLEEAGDPSGRQPWWQWRPAPAWSIAVAAVGLAGVLAITRGGEFLYWQF
jgi:D-alanyl-lipoteichoic acid acyltransferase DltB (MBOAT superfamily)